MLGNPTATLTHTVNEPNAGGGHDHAFTQPSNHSAWSHTITEPNAGAGHDHGFTQPNQHGALSHSVTDNGHGHGFTQADSHTGVEPPFYSLAFIMRTS